MFGIDTTPYTDAGWTILAAALGNVSCGVLGCFLVLRRMSMLGDAISHAILPGLVLGYLFSGQYSFAPIFVGAMIFGVLTALLTHSLHTLGNVPEDASMGAVFTTLFAVGVLLITSFANRVHIDPDCVLYGQIEFVPLETTAYCGVDIPIAIWKLGIAFAATMLFITLFWKELTIASFDPALATSMGLSAMATHYMLMGMVAGVTVAAFESVGSILVVAMLIVPGATAHLLSDRLLGMILWSAAVGVVSAVAGYIAAVWLDTNVAGMMAVAAGVQFGLAVALAPRHGLASKILNNLELSLRIVGEDIIGTLYRGEERSTPMPLAECLSHAGGGLRAWLALGMVKRQGKVSLAGGGDLVLTDDGRRLARSIVRSHRLWETFQEQQFDLPRDHLHEIAHRVEHFIGPELQEEIDQQLDRPTRDPHGQEIPPAE